MLTHSYFPTRCLALIPFGQDRWFAMPSMIGCAGTTSILSHLLFHDTEAAITRGG